MGNPVHQTVRYYHYALRGLLFLLWYTHTYVFMYYDKQVSRYDFGVCCPW